MRHEQRRRVWIGLGNLVALVLLSTLEVLSASPFRNGQGPQLSPSADAIVFVGAGRLGDWETRFTASNDSAVELFVRVGVTLDFPGGCPETGCPGYESMDLAQNGSATTLTPGVGPLEAIYFRGAEGDTLPVVTGQTINLGKPGQTADVPGFRLSHLLNLNLAVLSFPNARSGQSRSNLVLTNLLTFEPIPIRGGEINVLVQAYSPSGNLLGSMTQTISAGTTVLLQNVYEALGGEGSEPGQLRVTRVSGDRAFWGVLYTLDENGGVSTSPPLNL